VCGAAAVLCVLAIPALAQEPAHRVLIVFEAESGQPASSEIALGLRRSLDEDKPTEFEIFNEHLDSNRFPEPSNLERMAHLLAEKYRATKLDAIVAVGPTALHFLVDNRDAIAPGVPLFFGGVTEETAHKVDDLPDVKGVVSTFDIQQTMMLARKLQPTASDAVVLTGSAPFDKSWQDTAKAALGESYAGFRVRYVSDLSISEFGEYAAGLTPDTAVVVLTIVQDSAGQKFIPRVAATAISTESAAPIYAVYDTFIGRGAMAGYVPTFEDIGRQLGGTVKDYINKGSAPPKVTLSSARPVVDWRQMVRFGINPDLLPADAEVRYRTASLWDQYRPEILAIVAFILLQTATIGALIFQGRRRRTAEAELATGRTELAHLSRASLLGELSGAFAHELNQPLTSILANAQVGRQLIAEGRAGSAELGEILADIEADDRRAAAVITQLRRLLMKGETALETADLNRIAASTIQLVKGELLARQIRIKLSQTRDPVPVSANFAQLQQVVLNLVVNAADANQPLPAPERLIGVAVRKRGGWGEIIVSDNGKGLSLEMQEEVFKPFVSTKSKGLGLGLSICRSIAKAHGGRLRFDPDYITGARVILSVPLEGRAYDDRRISGPFGG
jgi:signal transduction histidine kinase